LQPSHEHSTHPVSPRFLVRLLVAFATIMTACSAAQLLGVVSTSSESFRVVDCFEVGGIDPDDHVD